MSLAPGVRLGTYEIVAAIGAGGMGEVYRARDTQLNRDVAIKILPELFAADADRVARFQREAQVLASLTHPNIAQIYGLEEAFGGKALVLELVDGPTLADLIAKGPIRVDEALPLARQIAEALEAAHEHGIIHRDLKPANIKLSKDGTVKVLDFGLAKPSESRTVTTAGLSMSPTITSPALMTGGGAILGTAAYMSPEQAKGKLVDKRTDIWAFGCVLYEMLTAKRAFDGDSVAETIARILDRTPDWTALPPTTSQSVRRLLRRALEKDARNRLADIADARLEVVDHTDVFSNNAHSQRKGRWPERVALIGAAVLLCAITSIATIRYQSRPDTASPAIHFTISPPDGSVWPPLTLPGSTAAPNTVLAISPDGRRVAYTARAASGVNVLWVRAVDALTPTALAGTEGVTSPFWSPDSTSIGFFADGKLKKIDAAGGPVTPLTDSPNDRGATWGDIIVFAPRSPGSLRKVSPFGGAVTDASSLVEGEEYHARPHFLPDGKHFIYRATGRDPNPNAFYLASIETAQRTLLMRSDAGSVAYSAGHLLFARDGVLMAQPFDSNRMALAGDAFPVAQGVQMSTVASPYYGVFSASRGAEMLAYLTGDANLASQLSWYDRFGKRISVLGDGHDVTDVELSPDGSRVAVSRLDRGLNNRDIWIIDGARKTSDRITYDQAAEITPIWSPDGTRLLFGSNRTGRNDIYRRAASSAGTDELIIEDKATKYPVDWSSDGRFALYVRQSGAPTGNDLVMLSNTDRKATPFIVTPFSETNGRFSPDGKWVAYQSNKSGQGEIYVASFPDPVVDVRISSESGIRPRWRRDGKELFYVSPNKLMRVSIAVINNRLQAGVATPVLEADIRLDGRYSYDVSRDGQRFLINEYTERGQSYPMTVLTNWTTALKK